VVWRVAVCFTHDNVPLLILESIGIVKVEMGRHFQGLGRQFSVPEIMKEGDKIMSDI
jgi:hypothetical protein